MSNLALGGVVPDNERIILYVIQQGTLFFGFFITAVLISECPRLFSDHRMFIPGAVLFSVSLFGICLIHIP
ncbi:MAG: hypothetical protein J5966_05565, partial [Lachnospiraceae bacterium]|nr:hypothetical protein [Lachnospiraceae bacterium]